MYNVVRRRDHLLGLDHCYAFLRLPSPLNDSLLGGLQWVPITLAPTHRENVMWLHIYDMIGYDLCGTVEVHPHEVVDDLGDRGGTDLVGLAYVHRFKLHATVELMLWNLLKNQEKKIGWTPKKSVVFRFFASFCIGQISHQQHNGCKYLPWWISPLAQLLHYSPLGTHPSQTHSSANLVKDRTSSG